MRKMILFLLMTAAHLTAHAGTQVYYGNTGWFSQGDTLNYSFYGPTYVEKALISAVGSRSFTMAQVYADGELVSNMGIPGNDPDYPVVIRKKVTEIVIKFQGSVKILDFRIYADSSKGHRHEQSDVNISGSDSVAELAAKASEVVEFLQRYVSNAEFQTYLKPIRKSAILLEASASGRNSTSEFTRNKAIQLITAIKKSEKMMDRMLDSSYYSQSALALITIKEALERKYDIHVIPFAGVDVKFAK